VSTELDEVWNEAFAEGYAEGYADGRDEAPGATEVKPNERPPFGCCLLVWSR
jgi:flagellar biosynthesis/type III secretory pathway protein FliH